MRSHYLGVIESGWNFLQTQKTFDKQLFNDLPTSGAQRRANTDLAIARKRTRQQKIGDIHARDEQNAARHRAQHEQSRTRVADHRAEFRHYFRARVYLSRILSMP